MNKFLFSVMFFVYNFASAIQPKTYQLEQGSLTNRLDNGIPVTGELKSQKCSQNGKVTEVELEGTSHTINWFKCHIHFDSLHSDIGDKVCKLAKDSKIGAAECISNEGQNPVGFIVKYNGYNFKYSLKELTNLPTFCLQIDGDWQLIKNPGTLNIISNRSSTKMHVKQEGCGKIEVSYSKDFTNKEKEPILRSGIYINDEKTPPSWDSNSEMLSSTLTVEEWSVEERKNVKVNVWRIYPKLVGSSIVVTERKSNGWSKLDVCFNYYNGAQVECDTYIKIESPIEEGSCHNLETEKLPPGFVCKTSSGFRWKKTTDGWEDLAEGGKLWSSPNFSGSWFKRYTSDFFGADKYCASIGGQLPNVPLITSPNCLPNMNYHNVGCLDFEHGDIRVAYSHQIQEVIPELFGITMNWNPSIIARPILLMNKEVSGMFKHYLNYGSYVKGPLVFCADGQYDALNFSVIDDFEELDRNYTSGDYRGYVIGVMCVRNKNH